MIDSHSVQIYTWKWQEAPAETPRQIFAIGDVHGRADLLGALHAEVRRIARPDALLIHLGDYIDRGPWSIEALRMVLDGVGGLEVVNLPGNHEQFLAAALVASPNCQFEIMQAWLDNGGRAIARELGRETSPDGALARTKLLDAIRSALGEHRLNQLLSLQNHLFVGGYLFVHGGINPAIPLAEFLARNWHDICEDEDRDPLWTRRPFFDHEGPYQDGIVVIHGHTPRDEPEILGNRINLDTRAFDSGRLTAVELIGRRLRIIQAAGPARSPD